MFFYILGLAFLFGILGVAVYVLLNTIRRERLIKLNEYKVLQSPDTVVDTLISELLKLDKKLEDKELYEVRKTEILNTFVELHRSGSFCAHLTEEEVTRFVKNKLTFGD